MSKYLTLAFLLLSSVLLAQDKAQLSGSDKSQPIPRWIWHQNAHDVDEAVFRRTFTAKAGQKVILRGTCDNEMVVFVNGKTAGESSRWENPVTLDVSKHVVDGPNEVRITGKDHGGIAALAFAISVGDAIHVTDSNWQSATPEAAKKNNWSKAIEVGVVGDRNLPWNQITAKSFGMNSPAAKFLANQTAKVADLNLPKGFKGELVYSVPKPTQGSWVAITTDDKGRLYTSDQGRLGIYRVTPATLGDPGSTTKVEKVNVSVSGAHGMCWAHDSLYVNAYGSGVWRIQDSDGDDQLDSAKNIVPIKNGGEHGMHAVIKSPDGKGICFLAGNHSPPPKFDSSTIPTNWSEDLLLPRNWDPRGHARGKLAPGGWIARANPDGSNVRILSVGYRNQYDIALNQNGEMFTYDADMEWDTGTPWYRPTRVCHVTSGSEFGWRSGSGKWPAYFEDSVPPVVDIGPGSPTGVVFGTGARFPAKYQKALFILDWTFGTIYAIHLQPDGATYQATKETFAWSKPLPVTDTIIGKDGAMYFTIGGRGTDSALYRIYYDGSESTEPVSDIHQDGGMRARELRRELESYHTPNPNAVAFAWPFLNNQDRAIRYAARIAIENQPVKSWREAALNEKSPQALVMAMIALARQGGDDDLNAILNSLSRLDLKKMPPHQVAGALRAWSLAFSRLGKPDKTWQTNLVSKLDPLFPTGNKNVDTELARLLVYLESDSIVAKSLGQIANPQPTPLPDWTELAKRNDNYGRSISTMLADMPPLQSIQYAFMLRSTTKGWTPELREAYFQFFVDVSKKKGGPSYSGYLTKAREDAMAKLSLSEKSKFAELLGRPLVAPAVKSNPPKGPGRKWKLGEAVSVLGKGLRNRDFASGKNLYHALSCSKCHYFSGSGGAIGPDLTSVANKFSSRDLLESIIEPSKVISDQYGSKKVIDIDGRMATGLMIEDGDKIQIYSNDASQPPMTFNRDDIEEMKDSNVSQMPVGLLDAINEEELKDLIAYLKSGGNRRHPMFKR